ncbi:MAG: hypothetical protein HY908_08965 [Myxococcales bacterium]|nr:hypothetical protein [Myxococcales bacterium]
MKKLILIVLLAAALAGVAVYFLMVRGGRTAVCHRLGELCGKGESATAGKCTDSLTRVEEAIDPEAMRKVERCVLGAKSCAEAAGCMSGMGLKAVKDVATDVFDGLKKAFE